MRKWLALCAVLSTASTCPTPRPVVTSGAPSATVLVDVVVSCAGQPESGATVTIDGQAAVTNAAGWVRLIRPRDAQASFLMVATGDASACAGRPYASIAIGGVDRVGGSQPGPLTVTLDAKIHPVSRLHVEGGSFRDPSGQIFKWHGVTAFTAFQDWTAGHTAKLEQFANDLKPYGVNVWRTFGMWSVTGFDYRHVQDYQGQLVAFLTWASNHGLYVQFTLFTDQTGTSVTLSDSEQRAALSAAVNACRQVGNCFLELSNEDWKNGQVAAKFSPSDVSGVLTARSAAASDAMPDQAGSILDWTTSHTDRGNEQERKSKDLVDIARLGFDFLGHWTATNKPAVAGEPFQLGTATPQQSADYAAVADLFGAGSNVHDSNPGLQSCIVSDAAKATLAAVAQVWAAGIPSQAAAEWSYVRGQQDSGGVVPLVHRDITDDPQGGALRTFCMTSDHLAICVPVSKGPAYQAIARNGWTITSQGGFNQDVIRLSR